jgi:FAD:protein FMN transferase
VPAVTCEEEGRALDLGGIGKGFALDELAALMADWGVGDALIAAGASSMRAVGESAWPVELAGNSGGIRISLAQSALSASGTGVQGAHILHPAEGGELPLDGFRRVWVVAPDAASAEVWSTAMMLVPPAALRDWLTEGGDFQRVVVEDDDGLRTFFPI